MLGDLSQQDKLAGLVPILATILIFQLAVMEEPCPVGKGHQDGQGAASPSSEQRGEIARCEDVGRAKGASAEQASLSAQCFCARGFLFLSSFYLHPFFEEAADERAHHSHQTPIRCIKGNVFGFMVCFEGTSGKMS